MLTNCRIIFLGFHLFRMHTFIFVSSVSVYGADNKSGKIDEMTKCLPKTLYGKSKSDAENLVINKCNDANIKYVIINEQ